MKRCESNKVSNLKSRIMRTHTLHAGFKGDEFSFLIDFSPMFANIHNPGT